MSELRFEWDERKARENKRKHGVSFEEAESVFSDDYGLLIDDPDHSGEEDRFLLLGLRPMMSYESSQLGRQPGKSGTSITGGGAEEERV